MQLLSQCLGPLYSSPTIDSDVLPITVIFDMVWSHSKFLEVMCSLDDEAQDCSCKGACSLLHEPCTLEQGFSQRDFKAGWLRELCMCTCVEVAKGVGARAISRAAPKDAGPPPPPHCRFS